MIVKFNRTSHSADADLRESYRQRLMKVRPLRASRIVIYAVLAALALSGQPAHADALTANLNCILAGSNLVSCSPSFFFGTVTLDDSVGGGQISLTVNVQGYAGKFRDLMLNFDDGGTLITSVTSEDGQASLLPDGFSLPPYNDGMFDVGGSGAKGWYSDNAHYTTLLTGSSPLTLDMFNVRDSQEHLSVALLLQDLTSTGDSSPKVGGIWEGGDPPQEIPEPTTAALLSSGLILLALASRRREVSQRSRSGWKG